MLLVESYNAVLVNMTCLNMHAHQRAAAVLLGHITCAWLGALNTRSPKKQLVVRNSMLSLVLPASFRTTKLVPPTKEG